MSDLLRAYERSPNPLYVQVAAVMKQRIDSGYWQPGQRIATVDELEREFKVARITVRQAVDVLRQEGLLRSRQGRGTFVSERRQPRHWLKLASDWDGLLSQLKANVPRRITVTERVSPPVLNAEDGVAADEYVLLHSVQDNDGTPYSIVSLHLARTVFRRAKAAFMRSAAISVIAGMDGLDLSGARQTLQIGSADPETADQLGVALGAPTAECRCVVNDAAGTAIYVAQIIYRSDCIKLEIDLIGRRLTG